MEFFSLFEHISTFLDRVITKSSISVRTSEGNNLLICQIFSFAKNLAIFREYFRSKFGGLGTQVKLAIAIFCLDEELDDEWVRNG